MLHFESMFLLLLQILVEKVHAKKIDLTQVSQVLQVMQIVMPLCYSHQYIKSRR